MFWCTVSEKWKCVCLSFSFGGPLSDVMGCGLRKMKPTTEEKSPGKIYSTLKRPQVETKVGVAYTYRYLDFLIGKDGKASKIECRILSLR